MKLYVGTVSYILKTNSNKQKCYSSATHLLFHLFFTYKYLNKFFMYWLLPIVIGKLSTKYIYQNLSILTIIQMKFQAQNRMFRCSRGWVFVVRKLKILWMVIRTCYAKCLLNAATSCHLRYILTWSFRMLILIMHFLERYHLYNSLYQRQIERYSV